MKVLLAGAFGNLGFEILKVLTDKAAIAALHTRALDVHAGLSLFDCVLMRQVYRLKYAKKKEG